jgi:hypothetical protein
MSIAFDTPGRTAELVRTAHVVSSQQKTVLRIVRNLALLSILCHFHGPLWKRASHNQILQKPF